MNHASDPIYLIASGSKCRKNSARKPVVFRSARFVFVGVDENRPISCPTAASSEDES